MGKRMLWSNTNVRFWYYTGHIPLSPCHRLIILFWSSYICSVGKASIELLQSLPQVNLPLLPKGTTFAKPGLRFESYEGLGHSFHDKVSCKDLSLYFLMSDAGHYKETDWSCFLGSFFGCLFLMNRRSKTLVGGWLKRFRSRQIIYLYNTNIDRTTNVLSQWHEKSAWFYPIHTSESLRRELLHRRLLFGTASRIDCRSTDHGVESA